MKKLHRWKDLKLKSGLDEAQLNKSAIAELLEYSQELYSLLEELSNVDPVSEDRLCVYCDSYRHDHTENCPWTRARKLVMEP